MDKKTKGIGHKRKARLESMAEFAKSMSQACCCRRREIDGIDEAMEYAEYEFQHVANECENMLRGLSQYRRQSPDVSLLPHWAMLKYDLMSCSVCGYMKDVQFECTKEAVEHWHELYEEYRFCPHCGMPMIDPDQFCPHCGMPHATKNAACLPRGDETETCGVPDEDYRKLAGRQVGKTYVNNGGI